MLDAVVYRYGSAVFIARSDCSVDTLAASASVGYFEVDLMIPYSAKVSKSVVLTKRTQYSQPCIDLRPGWYCRAIHSTRLVNGI
jgi:hypothetical protein